MENIKQAKSALISVFDKDGLEDIVEKLNNLNICIYSTGGTENFIKNLGIPVIAIEEITSYPSILGGRVKTLHPKIFGGILNRRSKREDIKQIKQYDIPQIDIVIVDLYPFEKTLNTNASHESIIEKIDIGGISLIRSAAKNFNDVVCVPSKQHYSLFLDIITDQNGITKLEQRKYFAAQAFNISSHYDTVIFKYLNEKENVFKESFIESSSLRYGENPHQRAKFYGDLNKIIDKLNGKELSFNNLLDVDVAIQLIDEFKGEPPTFAILKHNNACGVAQRETINEAYRDSLAADPISAFGGILISNVEIDKETAKDIDKLFCEIVIAPCYDKEAISILSKKKKRIILVQKNAPLPSKHYRTALNGVLVQDKDNITDNKGILSYVSFKKPSEKQVDDLLFASKVCKHTKSNTIVLVKDKQLLASGTGQTSRVDALEQAIEKAKKFNFNLSDTAMASDAFFPFPDCVEIADKAGITSIIQPGGSIKDSLSIKYCNENNIAMVLTGTRHFKH